MGFDGQDQDPAAFGVLAGEQIHGLGGEGGVVGSGDAAERGDDGVVDAADADVRSQAATPGSPLCLVFRCVTCMCLDRGIR